MTKWLYEHWGYAVLAAGAALWHYWRRIYNGIAWLFGVTRQIHETQNRLADGFQRQTSLVEKERDEAQQECEELKTDLRTIYREKLMLEDAGRQQRALISALKRRMEDRNLDYSDIDDRIQRQFFAK